MLLSSAAFAQTGPMGMLSGKVTDVFGDAVSGARVRAKDASGKEFQATSSATGDYTVDKLPPGAYEVTVTALTMKKFVKEDLAVAAGGISRLDVKLADTDTLGRLGDGDRFSVGFFGRQKRSPPPTGPVPRLPDGTPDLSGFWAPAPVSGQADPEPLPWAQAIYEERQNSHMPDDPYAHCLPRGIMSWAGQGKFVHTSSILVMLSTGEAARQIFLDGRGHPKEPNPSWQGHSVGRWEGDTLVVDTLGFNGLAWFNRGLPSTEMLHVVERYHRADLGHLETEITIEDPPVLRKPFPQKRISELALDQDIQEFICTENEKDAAHMVGK